MLEGRRGSSRELASRSCPRTPVAWESLDLRRHACEGIHSLAACVVCVCVCACDEISIKAI